MDVSKDIAGRLLDREAVIVKTDPPFTWASGIKSPVYCDNRKMMSFVGDREEIVKAFVRLIEEKGFDYNVIGGTATAAIPWAAYLAHELHKPMIYIRPEKKEHGAGKQIEGYLPEGTKVLIIEDLISTGGSSVKAAEAVREAGSIVTDVLAIVSWEMPKAITSFKEANLNLETLTGYTDIIGLASERGVIPEEQIVTVLQFKEDPSGWAEKMNY
ncbi:MAG: orotate phosphoribosyltransferase [bacterium]|nr:orotate phosphoribosyltransferase [bacterium]